MKSFFNFDIPTLVTITAPTCAGKNHLLEALVKEFEWGRIVSTTTRRPRDGEVEGVHYFFIARETSVRMEAQDLFAEIVEYNGTRYGVTKSHMENKLTRGMPPPIVILEPSGLEQYRKYCGETGVSVFSIFVSTPEDLRIRRLTERTVHELDQVNVSDSMKLESFHHIVNTNNKRLKAVFEKERFWQTSNVWDAIVDGTNLTKALEQVAQGVKSRNARADIYK